MINSSRGRLIRSRNDPGLFFELREHPDSWFAAAGSEVKAKRLELVERCTYVGLCGQVDPIHADEDAAQC